MRHRIYFILSLFLVFGCDKDPFPGWGNRGINYDYGRDLQHEMIVLGDRLENPYKTVNVERALRSLYPTKAEGVKVETNRLYVRFLPKNDRECSLLEICGVELIDHPLDYEIKVEGDYYHDPAIEEGEITWQYAVVPSDFVFPNGVEYEIIDECFIADSNAETRASGIDWDAVEREAFVLTGNEEMVEDIALTKAGSSKVKPAGRITIVDDEWNEGKPFGVAGVCVACNVFVKIAKCYTDRDGYYAMSKSFSAKPRYRLMFKNAAGFSIGFNFIIVPASLSTLGKAGPEGINFTITKDCNRKLFNRCVVNNAAYDYYKRCDASDMNILPPPSDLRIWLLSTSDAGSAAMLHHGALLDSKSIESIMGKYVPVIKYFLPDITLGTKDLYSYSDLYSMTVHELAHASHFSKVGRNYWDKYILYIVKYYIETLGKVYGDGSGNGAGYCEVGEMWAYYMQSKMMKERYGGAMPSYGTSFWFYPQIMRDLDSRGIVRSDIFNSMTSSSIDCQMLKSSLIANNPSKKIIIEQSFSRYGK